MAKFKSFLRRSVASRGAPPFAGAQAAQRHHGIFALEPRVMFDGAAADMLVREVASHVMPPIHDATQSDDLLAALRHVAPPTPLTAQPQHEIAFIDGSLADVETLIADVGPGVEVHVLQAGQDGVAQIAAVLRGRDDVSAIHLFGHGAAGQFQLGTAELTSQTITGQYADELADIGAALTGNADILIYGCDFGQGQQGEAAVTALANATGADVAASDDTTGAASLGGDWVLERTAGAITAASIHADDWGHTLAITINPTGGSAADSADGIRIYVGNNGQLQIARALTGSAGGSFQLYHPGVSGESNQLFNGIYLAMGSQVTGPNNLADGGISNGIWQADSQTLSGSGTGPDPYIVTTVMHSNTDGNSAYNAATDAKITIETVYTLPNAYFTERVTITPPTGNTNVIKFYHAMDTYLSGGDNGPAFSLPQNLAQTGNTTSVPTLVAVRKDPGGPNDSFVGFAQAQGSLQFDHWYSDFYTTDALYGYSTTAGIQGGGNITNSWNTDPNNDNAVAIQFTLGAITQSTSFSYHVAFGGEATLDLDLNDSSGATGSAFNAYYPYGSTSSIPIVDSDVAINNIVGDITQVRATLSNGQAGDNLTVNTANLPAGITVISQSSSEIVLGSTSPQSEENYQLALQTLGFATTNSSLASRNINFAVTNELGQEGLASAGTIVINRAPSIVSDTDTVYSNDATPQTGNVLSNDSDPDATNTLHVYDVANSSGQPVVVGSGGTVIQGDYGTLTINQGGTYSYVLDTNNPALQGMTLGQKFNDVFTYTGIDVVMHGSTAVPQGGSGSVQLNFAISPPIPASPPQVDLSGPTFSGGGVAFNYAHTTSPGSALTNASSVITSSAGIEVAGPGLAITYPGTHAAITGASAADHLGAIAAGDYIEYTFTTASVLPADAALYAFQMRDTSGSTPYQFALQISSDGFATSSLLGRDFNGGVTTALNSFDTADFTLQAGTAYTVRAYVYGAGSGTVLWDDFRALASSDPVNNTVTFTEGGSAVAIAASNMQIEDTDTTTLAGGTVQLTNEQAGDQLLIGSTALANGATGTISGITYAVTQAAGTTSIALTGNATHAAYAALLQSISFQNLSQDPSTVDRNVTVTLSDGTLSSTPAATLIHVIAVNNAPTLDLDGNNSSGAAGVNYQATYTENATPIPIADVDISITDPDNPNMASATIVLTNAQVGDVLSIAGSLPTGISAAINTSVTGQITVSLSGAASSADYQTAIDALRFSNTSNNPATINRNITVMVNDGTAISPTATSTIHVVAINDPPVIIDPASPGTPEYPIEAPDPANIIPDVTAADGTTPGSINLSTYVADPEGDSLAYSATGLPPGLSLNTTTGIISGTLTHDASQGGPGSDGVYPVTITISDSTNPPVTSTVNYTVTNTLPAAHDDEGDVTEDTTLTVTAANGLLANDTDADGDPLTVSNYTITGLGTFAANAAAVIPGVGTLTIHANGSYSFAPAPNFDGTIPDISYAVIDGDGGTATASLALTMTAANDPPVIIDPENPGTPLNPIEAPDPANIIPGVTADDSATPSSIDVSDYVADPEGAALTYAATGLPPGLTINAITGVISGTLTANASQGGPGHDGQYLATITYAIGNPLIFKPCILSHEA